MTGWQLVTRDTGRTVVDRLEIADRYWSRLRGLQFCRELLPGHGLLLVPCGSIHTMWMRFAIDVAMLDRAGRVLALRQAIQPWRFVLAPRGTHAILEMLAGTLEVAIDETLVLRHCDGRALPPVALASFSVKGG